METGTPKTEDVNKEDVLLWINKHAGQNNGMLRLVFWFLVIAGAFYVSTLVEGFGLAEPVRNISGIGFLVWAYFMHRHLSDVELARKIKRDSEERLFQEIAYEDLKDKNGVIEKSSKVQNIVYGNAESVVQSHTVNGGVHVND